VEDGKRILDLDGSAVLPVTGETEYIEMLWSGVVFIFTSGPVLSLKGPLHGFVFSRPPDEEDHLGVGGKVILLPGDKKLRNPIQPESVALAGRGN
jgi:hypothetical protein